MVRRIIINATVLIRLEVIDITVESIYKRKVIITFCSDESSVASRILEDVILDGKGALEY